MIAPTDSVGAGADISDWTKGAATLFLAEEGGKCDFSHSGTCNGEMVERDVSILRR